MSHRQAGCRVEIGQPFEAFRRGGVLPYSARTGTGRSHMRRLITCRAGPNRRLPVARQQAGTRHLGSTQTWRRPDVSPSRRIALSSPVRARYCASHRTACLMRESNSALRPGIWYVRRPRIEIAVGVTRPDSIGGRSALTCQLPSVACDAANWWTIASVARSRVCLSASNCHNRYAEFVFSPPNGMSSNRPS